MTALRFALKLHCYQQVIARSQAGAPKVFIL